MKNYIFLILLFSVTLLSAKEYTVSTVPNPRTADRTNFVSNPDNILDEPTVVQINKTLQSLEADTKAEVAVVMLSSIGSDDDIEDFAVHLFEAWGIGKKKLDNGLLILFILDQRAVRFEVGYGLEGVLTDAICKRIQMLAMIPEFKNENYNAGMLAGVKRVADVIRKEPLLEEEKETIHALDWYKVLLIASGAYLLLVFISLFSEKSLIKKIKNNTALLDNQKRYEAFVTTKQTLNRSIGCLLPLTGGFLCFFGQYGLLFGIPLIFSFLALIPVSLYRKRWKSRFREQPFPCPHCGNEMRHLSEKEDNNYLDPPENMEDDLQSVDADVFLCDQCQQSVVYRYDNKSSKYRRCPRCQTKAFYLQGTKTVIHATYANSGLAKETYICKFCNYTEVKDKKLPRLTNNSGSGGGFGGGGHSGGSFGGGRSGGGGSTSRW